jgi:hypothetical protein
MPHRSAFDSCMLMTIARPTASHRTAPHSSTTGTTIRTAYPPYAPPRTTQAALETPKSKHNGSCARSTTSLSKSPHRLRYTTQPHSTDIEAHKRPRCSRPALPSCHCELGSDARQRWQSPSMHAPAVQGVHRAGVRGHDTQEAVCGRTVIA